MRRRPSVGADTQASGGDRWLLKEKKMRAIVDEERCLGCGVCESTCPEETIRIEE